MATLEPLALDLWIATRPLPIAVGDIGARMTVIRSRAGGVLLHSPVVLDVGLREAVGALGPVRWIVAPCRAHHLFLADWARAFPDAALCGVPGLPEKCRGLRFTHVVPDAPPADWPAEVGFDLVGGAPLLNEVAFLHRPSRTLVLADLVFNVRPGPANRARVFHWLVGATGRFGPHRIVRFALRDRAAARRSIDRILAWDFDRVIMSHGEVVESGGHALLERAFGFLGT